MKVFAIDPGNVKSAYCVIDSDSLRPLNFDIIDNDVLNVRLREEVYQEGDCAVIEMVESYGMSVGRDVFETVFWIGRFYETLKRRLTLNTYRVYRTEEKLHICQNRKAKDSNISRALIDRFAVHDMKNGKGTKGNPDWFYGFKKDLWQAYAVGLTFIETILNQEV